MTELNNELNTRKATHLLCVTVCSCTVNCREKHAVTSSALFAVECSTCSDTDRMSASYVWDVSLFSNVTGEYESVPDAKSYFSHASTLVRHYTPS
jgi:hypothetical protein